MSIGEHQEVDSEDDNYAQDLVALQDEVAAHVSLAWVYATATRHGFQNTEKALDHAKKAVFISKGCEALLFSTLAWTSHISGEVEEALSAGEMALRLDPENKRYKEQLEIYRNTEVKLS